VTRCRANFPGPAKRAGFPRGAAATLLLACAGVAGAAPPTPAAGQQPGGHWVTRTQARLVLEPAQQQELRRLVEENAARMRQIQASHVENLSPERDLQLRAAINRLQREFREDLGRILTAGQLAEWDALLEDLLGAVHLRFAARPADASH